MATGSVVHWFRADRPGQTRSIPDIMPALPLFAQLRRFTLTVIAAAETAADFAVIRYTERLGERALAMLDARVTGQGTQSLVGAEELRRPDKNRIKKVVFNHRHSRALSQLEILGLYGTWVARWAASEQ